MTLRGRAAQPIRPGFVVKGILLGQIPLATGELVTEASISDLGAAYKELIKRENALRPKEKHLRGMTSFSFKTLFKFAQLLNLVELVREEPMLYPPPGGPLYSVRKPDGVHVTESYRRVFKLTVVGEEDERCWTNLNRAWREGWVPPQAVEYAPPYVPPVEVPPVKPPRPPVKPPPVGFAPFRWVERPSMRQFRALLDHLQTLEVLGIEAPGVSAEVDRLSMKLGGWVIEIEDSLEEAKAIRYTERIAEYEHWLGSVNMLSEALMDRDLRRGIESLKEVVG